MSDTTKIEWVDASFSPWIGCTKVSPGCAHCYAETLDARKLWSKETHWGKGVPRRPVSEAKWREPLAWNRKADPANRDILNPTPVQTVFPSICDWLDNEVPIEWLARFLKLIHDTPHLRWLLLTKRPELWNDRLVATMAHVDKEWLSGHCARSPLGEWIGRWIEAMVPQRGMASFPKNVWIGTSVENQKYADIRIPQLLAIPAVKRFLSVEPMLGPVNLGLLGTLPKTTHPNYTTAHTELHWVIFGGESGPGASPCNNQWIRDGVRQCREAGIAPFVKQLGAFCVTDEATPDAWPPGTELEAGCPQYSLVKLKHPKGGDMSEWPEDLRVREIPL